jgi:hypothetical protein
MELTAKRRLKEVFSFWHKAAANYQDVDEFVINLNACIQAIRNVTFALQGQKSQIDDFDNWYSSWQEALKQDLIMRWCVEARNTIVKSSDLKMNSVAKVSVHTNYLLEAHMEVNVEPLESLDNIVPSVSSKIPPELSGEGFLKVERQWKVDKLDEVELLSGIAHVATVLNNLVDDLDERKGPEIIYPPQDQSHEKFDQKTIHFLLEEYVPECMVDFDKIRTAWYKLPTLEQCNFREESIKLNRKEAENALRERNIDCTGPAGDESLKGKVLAYADIAKKMLLHDGYHINLVVLVLSSGKQEMIQTHFADQAEKFMFWKDIAKKVQRKGAKEIICLGEAWVYSVEDKFKYGDAQSIPDKKEALCITGMSQEGECISINVPFHLEGDKVVLSEESMHNQKPNYLANIEKVWKKKNRFKRK